MTDLLVLDLVDKGLVTGQMVLTVGYDIENLTDPARRAKAVMRRSAGIRREGSNKSEFAEVKYGDQRNC